MNLAIDSSGKYLTANYPYPTLVCTVNFKCQASGSISSDVTVTINYGIYYGDQIVVKPQTV